MEAPIHSENVRNSFPLGERCAVIDVGTNSVKLLVADVSRTVKPVLKLSMQMRLGEGAFRTRRLRPEAIARTVDAVAQFAAEAAALRPATIRVIATSAVRESVNGHDLIEAIRRSTGLEVEIISGEQEADCVFHGVTSDPEIGSQPVLIVDVGGGSTEWVFGERGTIYFRKSTCLGTSRQLELHPPGDPPAPAALAQFRATVSQFVRAEVLPSLLPVLRTFCGRPVRLVGLGGALQTLAQLSSAPKSARTGKCHSIERTQLVEQVERLWRLSVQERRKLAGLDPKKAEVILPGAVIHEAVLSELGFEEMLISSRGLREGTLLLHSARAGALADSARPLPADLPSARPASLELNLSAEQNG